MKFGEIEVLEQKGLTEMPQEAASAWHGAMGDILGASYVPAGNPLKALIIFLLLNKL